MNLEQFKAFAAENPQAAASFIEQGKNAGAAEARASEKARIIAVREACGGNDALAFDIILSGKDAEDAKLTVAAIAREKANAEAAQKAANDQIAAMTKEIERLKAEAGTQPAVGTVGAAASVASNAGAGASDKYAAMDDDTRIEAEWSDNLNECTTKFKVFNAYRGFRKSQMNAPKLPTK
jgi:hypothetical protein